MINGPSSRRRFLQAVSAGTVATAAASQSDCFERLFCGKGRAEGSRRAFSPVAASRAPPCRCSGRRRLDRRHHRRFGVCQSRPDRRPGGTSELPGARDSTAPLRPWIDLGKLQSTNIPAPFARCFEKMSEQAGPGEIPLWMDGLKLALEDLLLDASVQIVYASLPAQVLTDAGKVRGIVIGNKSGRQVLLAPLVLDCTGTALVARFGARPSSSSGRTT